MNKPSPTLIAQIGRLPGFAQQRLESLAEVMGVSAASRGTEVLVTDAIQGADVGVIERFPGLRLIAVMGVGLDRVDLALAKARGIAISNTPDVLTDDVADLAILLALAAARRVLEADRFVRQGQWSGGPMRLGRSARALTLGVVGLGRIGLATASRARAFGMTVLGWNRSPTAFPGGERVPTLLELARRSDILVVAVAGGPSSRGLIDRRVLQALGSSGILVNVARGDVVDEAALCELLETGALGFAALDVFAHEPFPSRLLIDHPHTLLQPHQGSATIETREAMGHRVVDNVAAWLDGRPLLTPAN